MIKIGGNDWSPIGGFKPGPGDPIDDINYHGPIVRSFEGGMTSWLASGERKYLDHLVQQLESWAYSDALSEMIPDT